MALTLRTLLIAAALLASFTGRSQSFVDSCFSSCAPVTSFPGSADLFSLNADLLEWTPTANAWVGAWGGANVLLPPPLLNGGCRAIWIGNGTTWTTGGEGFGLRLTAPLVTGQTYSFTFTYVSHGTGSNGNFAPFLYTHSTTSLAGATNVMTLPSVGAAWTTNTISFTATAGQNGHDWLIIHNGMNGSSGMFISFCASCSNVQPPQTCAVSLGNDTTLCNGNTLLLNATTSGASYLWQDNSTGPTYLVSGPGLYWVEIDDGACIARDSINVSFAAPPVVTITPDTTICPGQNVTLIATGGSSYLWSNASTSAAITVSPSATTTYSVLVTGSSCSTTDSVTVTLSAPIAATMTTSNVSCNGANDGSATVTPSGGNPPFTYAWTSGGTGATENNLSPGNYVVTITDASGCTQAQNAAITQPLPIVLNIAGSTTACSGTPSSFTATAQGGTPVYTYAWSGGLPNGASQNVTVTAQTTYTCTVTDANGCAAVQTITITPSPSPVAAFTVGPGGCAPLPVSFTDNSQGAVSYEWNFGDGSPESGATDPSHTYTQSGVYTVTLVVTSAAGCTDTLIAANAVQVSLQPVAMFSASSQSVSEMQPNVYFTDVSQNSNSCVFYFGDGDSTLSCGFANLPHAYPGAGNYCASLIATTAAGCSDTMTLCVDVYPDFAFYIPNAFTPNGNGQNDHFTGYGENVAEFHMWIFDRWGNLVYQTDDISKPWNGKACGGDKVAQTDTYVYKIEVKDMTGRWHDYVGGVDLVR